MSGFRANVPQRVVPGRNDERAMEIAWNQMREFANQIPSEVIIFTTDGTGGLKTLWESAEVPFDSTITVQAKVQGRNDDLTVFGSWELAALFGRALTGSVAQLGTTQDKHTAIESNALLDVRLNTAGNKLRVQVDDAALVTFSMTWTAWIELRVR